MDAREHRALLGALVVLGCLLVGFPWVAAGDGGIDGAGVVMEESELESVSSVSTGLNETETTNGTTADESTDDTEDDPDNETEDDPDNETAITFDNETTGPTGTPRGYDSLHVTVDVHENGSATWTLEYRFRLDREDNDTDQWEAVRENVEERPDAHLEALEANWSERTASTAEKTNRNMSVSRFTVAVDETSTPQETGYIRFQFQWKEFARVDLNRIEVGDAFGTFELDDRMQLIVTWPENFEQTRIEPTPDGTRDNAAIWNGQETDLLENEPWIELVERRGETTETVEEPEPLVSLTWLAMGGLLALVAVGIVGWWVLPTRQREEGSAEQSVDVETGAVSGAVTQRDELLSNEERVVALLEERGGRMKQQEIIAELGWTEAKTSQVVSGLRKEGDIEAFRIGRENVLTLPDDEGRPDS